MKVEKKRKSKYKIATRSLSVHRFGRGGEGSSADDGLYVV